FAWANEVLQKGPGVRNPEMLDVEATPSERQSIDRAVRARLDRLYSVPRRAAFGQSLHFGKQHIHKAGLNRPLNALAFNRNKGAGRRLGRLLLPEVDGIAAVAVISDSSCSGG